MAFISIFAGMSNALSAVIITYNEAENIERCVASLKPVADDIVVLDSFSSDNTKQLALQAGARVVEHNFDGHIQQKNRALEFAEHDFVLSLDADESLNEQLQESILSAKKKGLKGAYYFNRLNNFCGQWIRHGAWYPDSKVRLWNRKEGSWGGYNPHDKVVLNKGIKKRKLAGNLLHFSFKTEEEFEKKIAKYAEIKAKALLKENKNATWIKRFLSPKWRFVRDYFLKLGFLDGKAGFQIALGLSKETRLSYQKLQELQAD